MGRIETGKEKECKIFHLCLYDYVFQVEHDDLNHQIKVFHFFPLSLALPVWFSLSFSDCIFFPLHNFHCASYQTLSLCLTLSLSSSFTLCLSRSASPSMSLFLYFPLDCSLSVARSVFQFVGPPVCSSVLIFISFYLTVHLSI